MALLTRHLVGNGYWWGWDCPTCDRTILVSSDGAEPLTAELVEGVQTCPACNEDAEVDMDPRSR